MSETSPAPLDICANCGQALVNSFGRTIHDRQSPVFASLIWCLDGIGKAQPITEGSTS